MNIVLCHIGDNIPNYLYTNLNQIEKFNSNIDTYIIINKRAYVDKIKDYNVEIIYVEDVDDNFKTSHNFWGFATKRLFLVENIMRKNNLQNVLHIENDVLLYVDITTLTTLHKQNLAMTICGDRIASAAFMWVRNYKYLKKLNDEIKKLIQGNDIECSNNEMIIIKKIYDENKEILNPLPILPTDVFFEEYKTIFDPASWGQFVGGIPKNPSPKDKNIVKKLSKDHYIGIELFKNKYDIIFRVVNGKRIPILVNNKKEEFFIANLHIHSKQLEKYIS